MSSLLWLISTYAILNIFSQNLIKTKDTLLGLYFQLKLCIAHCGYVYISGCVPGSTMLKHKSCSGHTTSWTGSKVAGFSQYWKAELISPDSTVQTWLHYFWFRKWYAASI